MRIAAYTSCAINYLAKARVFGHTIREANPEIDVFLCLNDIVPDWFDIKEEPFKAMFHSSEFANGNPPSWIFKHNVMELSTAVKGGALVRLLEEEGYDYVFYFDPDCYVLSDPKQILDILGENSIGLTPHVSAPIDNEEGITQFELSVLKHGVYNLGFIIVKNDDVGRKFGQWWKYRLEKYCYADYSAGLFTDQKWIDLVPASFDRVAILRQQSLNLALWNINEREFHSKDGKFFAGGLPLVFYHYSGRNADSLHARLREKYRSDSPELVTLEHDYEALLLQHGTKMLERYPFGYNFYSNGEAVTEDQRRVYRNDPELWNRFPNPFQINGSQESYLNWFRFSGRRGLSSPTLSPQPTADIAAKLFDPGFYQKELERFGEKVQSNKINILIQHYVDKGHILGLEPNPFFDSAYYQKACQKFEWYPLGFLSNRMPPLFHFAEVGLAHKISPCEGFDENWYLDSNLDVRNSVIAGHFTCGYEHYLKFGAKERRRPGPTINEQDAPSDVSVLIGSTYQCYFEYLVETKRVRPPLERVKK